MICCWVHARHLSTATAREQMICLSRFVRAISHMSVGFAQRLSFRYHPALFLRGVPNRISCCCSLRAYPFLTPTPAVGQCVGQVDLRRRPRSLAVCHARARHGGRGRKRRVFGRLATPRADPRRGSEETRTGSIHGTSEFRPSKHDILFCPLEYRSSVELARALMLTRLPQGSVNPAPLPRYVLQLLRPWGCC